MKAKNKRNPRKSNIWLISLLIFSLASCVSQKKVTLLQQETQDAQVLTVENPRQTSYIIQTGDQLYIKVYSLDSKTSKFFQSDLPNLMNPTYLYLNSYTVDEEGYISFSFIERLFVRGLTVEQAREKVQEVLNKYFNETTAIVKLINFQVSVLGEVSRPGTYTIDKEYANILQAISLAGGTKDFANIRNVKLVRQTPTGSQVAIVDLSKIELLSNSYFHLMPNDVIYVEPLKMKSYAYTSFPYSILISAVSTAILIFSITK